MDENQDSRGREVNCVRRRRVREFTGGQNSFLDGIQPSTQLSPLPNLDKSRRDAVEAAVNWFYSRDLSLFYPAAPLLLAVTLFFLASGWGETNSDPSTRLADFKDALQLAIQSENHEQQHLCLSALGQIEPSNSSYAIQEADLYLTENRPTKALQVLSRYVDPVRSGSPDARLWLLRHTLSNKDVFGLTREDVLAQLHAVLRESRGNREAARTLARVYMMTREWQLAECALQDAANHSPDLNLNLLKLQIVLERPEEIRSETARLAVKGLEDLLAEQPGKPDVITRLAEAYYLNRDPQAARDLLNRSYQRDNDEMLARSLSRMETMIAEDLIAKSAAFSDVVCSGLLRAIELNPSNLRAIKSLLDVNRMNCVIPPDRLSESLEFWRQRAIAADATEQDVITVVWLYDLRGEYEEAADLLQKQLETSPQFLRYNTELLIKAGNGGKANLLAESELARIRRKQGENPGDLSLKRQLAEILLSLDRPSEVIELLAEDFSNLEMAPTADKAVSALYGEALVEYFDQQTELSGLILQRNVAAMPKVSDRLHGRRLIRLLTTAISTVKGEARNPIAMESIDRLVRLVMSGSPAADDAMRTLNSLRAEGSCSLDILNTLSAFALDLKRYDEAVNWLEIASHTARDSNPGILNNLAIALVRSQPAKPVKALEYANEAIRLMPDHADLLSTRGEIYIALSDWKKAEADLRKSLALRSDRSKVHRMMADALRGQGELDQARHHQNQALKLERGLAGQQAAL